MLAEDDWMMRRASTIKLVSFLLLTCSTSLISLGKIINVSNAVLQTATVSVSPSSVTIPINQNFTINVPVSGVSDLYGWEFQLGWNTTLLDVVNVSEGPFLKAVNSTFFTCTVDATAGNMIVDCTLLGITSGVSGNGTLGTVTFYVKSVGQCPLDLHDVILLNSVEQSIPCQFAGGYGYFTDLQSHDVAVTNVTASPTALLPGGVVNISVSVQDEGSFAEVFNVTAYADSQVIGMQTVSLSSNSSTTITFAWNTTGFTKGDYAILAAASVVLGETNTTNNNMQATNPVTLLYSGHDIAVINVQSSRTVVGQGYSSSIEATAKNYGIFTETFNTTIYVNGTAVYMQTVNLASGASATLAFAWNTTNFAYGNYTMSAHASTVPGENDTTNNAWVSGVPVHVGIAGDVSSSIPGVYDGIVNVRDIAYLVAMFNSRPASLNWNPNADVNGDGVVNVRDIAIAVHNFDEHE